MFADETFVSAGLLCVATLIGSVVHYDIPRPPYTRCQVEAGVRAVLEDPSKGTYWILTLVRIATTFGTCGATRCSCTLL